MVPPWQHEGLPLKIAGAASGDFHPSAGGAEVAWGSTEKLCMIIWQIPMPLSGAIMRPANRILRMDDVLSLVKG